MTQDERADLSVQQLKYDAAGLIPAIVQHHETAEVLMMAWMDAEAVVRTCQTGTTWFRSRSRSEYWNKGATSGNVQHVVEMRYDCDADCLLVLVRPEGPACHTGERSCFYRTLCGPFPVEGGPHVHFVPQGIDE